MNTKAYGMAISPFAAPVPLGDNRIFLEELIGGLLEGWAGIEGSDAILGHQFHNTRLATALQRYSAASLFVSIISTSRLSISCIARPAIPCKSP